MQIKYFTENFGLVMPEKQKLSIWPEDFRRVRTGKAQELKQQDFIYVPLVAQLKVLLNITDVYKEIMKPKPLTHGLFTCYENGLNFKNNILFKRHPQALQIHIYLDEVQMCCFLNCYDRK